MDQMDVRVTFREVDGGTVAVVGLPQKFQILSSAIIGGGLITADTVVIMQVPTNYDERDPAGHLQQVCRSLGIEGEVVGFMTAAQVRKVLSVSREELNGAEAVVVATAGLSNAVVAGEPPPMYTLADTFKVGTINIIAILNTPLNLIGMANAIITATEAKVVAIRERGAHATGTTSDAIAIATPAGEGVQYAGTATSIGVAMARAVKEAVLECLTKNGDGPRPTDYLMRLEEK
ncbi:MAG: adenosylcobinamide amidohydrolase, partial [Planctomycetes bacterium]|nr:adenosylcobinamide amidohydrolase [Planctomycetota bacterium]